MSISANEDTDDRKKTIGANFITICIMLHRLISRQSHLMKVLWFQLVILHVDSVIIQVHGYVNDDNENGVCA